MPELPWLSVPSITKVVRAPYKWEKIPLASGMLLPRDLLLIDIFNPNEKNNLSAYEESKGRAKLTCLQSECADSNLDLF